jgi:hypothetical protein
MEYDATECKEAISRKSYPIKLDYNDTVYYPLPAYLQKNLQRVQNAATSFVTNHYSSENDVLS